MQIIIIRLFTISYGGAELSLLICLHNASVLLDEISRIGFQLKLRPLTQPEIYEI